ncbi:ist1-like protein [Nannochloropsis oceanica]
MFAFIESFKPFDVNKVKPYLKMAVQRIQIATNKKTAAVKMAQREVANLLAQQKDEKAAIKVEAIIREDATIEAYGILELVCDLLHERARLVASEKECPEDLKSAVVTLIWATNRADIMELHEVKKQFAKKFGKEFVERAEKDEDRLVNERVAHKLSIRPPSAAIVEKYLREIALKNDVEWTPLEHPCDLTEDQKAFSSMPAPTGASVGMGPASGFGHLYHTGGAGGGGEGGGGGGGGGGMSMPIARPISPPCPSPSCDFMTSTSGSNNGDGCEKDPFQPPSRQPPPLPSQATATPSSSAPPSSPPFLPAAVEAGASAPVMTAVGVEGGGEGGPVYDIPLPPTTAPVRAEPALVLPPAPSTSGSGGPGGEVDDLLTRFQRLQQR